MGEVTTGAYRRHPAARFWACSKMYLLKFGFLSNFMASSEDVSTGPALMEVLSAKVGGVALAIGVVHLANVWTINAFRRRAVQRNQTPSSPLKPAANP